MKIELNESPTKEGNILWANRGGILPNGNFPVLPALTLGLLRGAPSANGQWLNILGLHLEREERPEVWGAMLDKLGYLRGCNRSKAIELVLKLFTRFPGLLATVEGVRFVASNHFWLPPEFFDQAMLKIEHSDWKPGDRAAGELWMLRAALCPDDDVAQIRFKQTLANLAVGDASQFSLGFVRSAANTWMTPEFRETSTEVLLAATSHAKDEIAEAIQCVLPVRPTRTSGRRIQRRISDGD